MLILCVSRIVVARRLDDDHRRAGPRLVARPYAVALLAAYVCVVLFFCLFCVCGIVSFESWICSFTPFAALLPLPRIRHLIVLLFLVAVVEPASACTQLVLFSLSLFSVCLFLVPFAFIFCLFLVALVVVFFLDEECEMLLCPCFAYVCVCVVDRPVVPAARDLRASEQIREAVTNAEIRKHKR